jgi:diguanylate cyclase (GGDEF)-like protein
VRSARSIEILCLALAALVLVWSQALARHLWPVLVLLAGFAAALLVCRSQRLFRSRTRLRLIVESWSMVAFVTGVLWFTGKSASPMLNLYLLPIILSALTLSRLITLAQVAVVCMIHALLALATPSVPVLSLSYASHAVGELSPILLVAYLRTFNAAWQRAHAASEARQSPYAVLMLDVDHLKSVNDAFGHEAGDSALNLVARCLQRSIRGTDCAGRFGGDEFTVLLPGATPDVAEAIVKRIRNNVYKTTLDLRSRMIRCSVSIGVANYPRDGREMRDLLSVADRNMYRDKELRRPPGTPATA